MSFSAEEAAKLVADAVLRGELSVSHLNGHTSHQRIKYLHTIKHRRNKAEPSIAEKGYVIIEKPGHIIKNK